MTIFVTNNSDVKLIDGYAGKKHEFLPNTVVEIDEDTARHIFGYGVEDKRPYLIRLGWLKSETDIDAALEMLNKWEISSERPKTNQSLSPLVEKVPLPSERKAGGKLLKAV